MLKKSQAAKRANKPLAWFLNEQLEKQSSPITMAAEDQPEQREGSSPLGGDNRKDSIDSLASSINSAKISEGKDDAANGKKKGKKGGRQRVKKVSVNFTIAGSENKEPLAKSAPFPTEEKPVALPTSVSAASMAINKDRKEDYWYYDPLSDGFYYENNGSRGWKKRNPKIHGPPPPAAPKKLPDLEKMDPVKFQKALIANQKLLNAVGAAPSVKYYDPASDGYFFDMPSVDGWRRRQPPNVAERERKPMNIPKPSVQASMANNNFFPPLGSFSSTTATPTPSPAGSFQPQPAMTNAQLEDLIIRHPSLVASMVGKPRLGGIFDEPCVPSNSSTTSSEELTSSPPPHISSQPEQSLLMQHFRRGQNLQQSSSASMLIHATNPCQTNTTFSVGSADEPYEFYWSDNEKASSISSYDDAGDKEQSVPRELAAAGLQMRPNTLSIGQDIKVKNFWDPKLQEQPNGFDVDKFIADLPSFNEDRFFRNLTSIATPYTDRQHSTGGQSSNLVTPLKENTWWTPYGNTPQKQPLDTTKAAEIWRTPCA